MGGEVFGRELVTLEELQQAEALLAEIWGATVFTADLLRALVMSGNYVAGQWRGGELLAASAGILGHDDDGLHLHSLVTGVRPGEQSGGHGYAQKQHQRGWALMRDIPRITWTFDPLVRRNAWFNLTRLGATVTAYHENLYGPMDDVFNRGDETDRCVASWRVHGDAVSTSEPEAPAIAAHVLTASANGAPVCHDREPGAVLLAWVPEDIVAIRERDSELARAWRLAARATIGAAIDDGWTATTVLRSGEYVLEPPS
jgi:predicted GNAT superfamily acetyltransferase